MGKDHQPKHRQQARDLRRRASRRAPYDRLLIVCEGKKTEPLYFNEIRQAYRLATANVQVLHSEPGTQPIQVVEYAKELFLEGDCCRGIPAVSFDAVYAVFDRDDHPTYHKALDRAAALHRKLKNDLGERVPFQAIASVPCFELWLLLHFEDVFAPLHRDEVYARLKNPASIPGYDKGQPGYWQATSPRLEQAMQRARKLAAAATAHNGTTPYTDVHQLVRVLMHLRD